MNRVMLFFVMVLGCAVNALATGTDFSTITGAFDVTGVTTGVLAISALLMVVYVAIKGARILLAFARR